jgi:hypothetical protein
MYIYQWRSIPGNHWDSGLLDSDGTPRPSYRVLAEHVGPRYGGTQRSSTPTDPAPASGWTGSGSQAGAAVGRWLIRFADTRSSS